MKHVYTPEEADGIDPKHGPYKVWYFVDLGRIESVRVFAVSDCYVLAARYTNGKPVKTRIITEFRRLFPSPQEAVKDYAARLGNQLADRRNQLECEEAALAAFRERYAAELKGE